MLSILVVYIVAQGHIKAPEHLTLMVAAVSCCSRHDRNGGDAVSLRLVALLDIQSGFYRIHMQGCIQRKAYLLSWFYTAHMQGCIQRKAYLLLVKMHDRDYIATVVRARGSFGNPRSHETRYGKSYRYSPRAWPVSRIGIKETSRAKPGRWDHKGNGFHNTNTASSKITKPK